MLLDQQLHNIHATSPAGQDASFKLIFTTTSQIVDVEIAVSGSPTILWTWSDDTTSSDAAPGPKDFGSATTREHTLYVSDWSLITLLDFSNTVSTAFDLMQLKSKNMTDAAINLIATAITGYIKNLPSGLTGNMQVQSTILTGTIADFPRGLTGLMQASNIAGLTGDFANLPSGCTGGLRFVSTGVISYTPGTWPCATGNSKTILFTDNSMSQASVDGVLMDLDAYGATDGTVNVSSNSIPSAAGLTAKTNLEGKGWTVTVDV